MTRTIRHHYTDPLDLIWLACARDVGLTVVRSDSVYASFDGAGTLSLSKSGDFDADDSLAQLVFHELCHALVAGPRRARRPDWGMENVDERDVVQEHACHRLQASLSDRHGLRAMFAVTTDFRPYWDSLPMDPLGPGSDPAISLAREAHARARQGSWAGAIETALTRTRQVADIVRETRPANTELWALTRPLHASGFPVAEDGNKTCGDCAWAFEARGLRCRQTRGSLSKQGLRIDENSPACVRFESQFDTEECGRCGACCRDAFDRVEVSTRDLVRKRHPSLISRDGFGAHLGRPGGRCVALLGDGQAEPYLCHIYADRPRSCADFQIAGDACLEARRRVGQHLKSSR